MPLAGGRLRAERDEAIRRAYREGLPVQDIAAVAKLSHQHVFRIVRAKS
jgi:transposase-like protein